MCDNASASNDSQAVGALSEKYEINKNRRHLKVNIFRTDITELSVDCIVNAANKRLQGGGGVAKAIFLAAGPALKQECDNFLLAGNLVNVTEIFISTGGNLPAKSIFHAVGPKWADYDDNNKAACSEDLRRTVIRCLVEADRQGFTSIAFPSISAAIFKVPKEVCAGCYMDAVKNFSMFNKKQTSLREIFFVDMDETIVKTIKNYFKNHWENPCYPHIVQRDCDFANTHFYSSTRGGAKYIAKLPDTNNLTSPSSLSAKTPGASTASSVLRNRVPARSTSDFRRESSIYQIGKFTLHTDSKPAFDHLSDITITVGEPFDKLSGICDFSVSNNNEIVSELKNTFKLLNVSTTKSLQEKQVCALLPEPDNAIAIQEAIENLDVIMQNPNHNILAQTITNIVMTSSILYKEPDNVRNKNQHSFDINKVEDLARYLFEYLNKATQIPSISITVVGCEDALQSFHLVMESLAAKTISQEDVGSAADLDTTCGVCSINAFRLVKCCGKNICIDCQQRMSNCPFCCSFWRILIGNQPPGTMNVSWIDDYADGFEKSRSWKLEYTFPSGRQTVYHPNPGAPYTGFFYSAYLPANLEGLKVLKLLRLAFLRKLTFTISRPLTTDSEQSIVWSVIHHKTSLHGGILGYPDSTYLLTVTKELINKGVSSETMSADEKSKIANFEYEILHQGHFTDTYPE